MANKTVEQLQKEFDAATDATRAAYDAWASESKYNKSGAGVAAQNKGSVKDLYERAIAEKDTKRIAQLKAEYDRLAAAYKKEQEKKNALRRDLAAAKKSEEEAKKKQIAGKSAGNVYTNALKDLAVAEAAINGYKGEEKYIAAYKAAQAAFQTATDAGKSVAALPTPKIEIPVEVTTGGGTTDGTKTTDKTLPEYINFLADPKNSSILKTVQQNLQKNFGYKGPVDGKWSLAFQNAFGKVAGDRATLPEVVRSGTLLDYIAAPGISTGVGGTGTGGTASTGKWGVISNESDAKAAISDSIKTLLGREATAKEITSITKKLQKAQKDNPYKKDASGMTVGGLNAGQFIEDIVKAGAEYKKKVESKTALTADDIRETARLNGLVLGEADIKNYANRIKAGEDIKTINQEIRNIAANGRPESIKKLLAAGTNLDSVIYPYKSAMANSLGINQDTIDINDPTLNKAIADPNGEMSLYDFKKVIRQDNRWKYSQEAHDEVRNIVDQVKRDFGFMG